MLRKPTRVVVLIVLGAVAGVAAGQETQAARPYEQAHANGDYRRMLTLALAELDALRATPSDAVAAADAEILLLRLHAMGGFDPAQSLSGSERAASRLEGWLGARAGFTRHAALSDLGRFDDAAAEAKRLGFIDEFLIAGPFDNERGAGQKVALAPETGPVDPEASFDGKDRKVTWRRIGPPQLGTVVDLADLLVPKEQSLAYLACTITSATDQVIGLGIGHSSFCRIWLDGAVVYEREVQRDDALPDQEHVALRLRAGKNEVLVKTGVVTGPFRLALRLAAPDGGPPPAGITISAAPDAFLRVRAEGVAAESRRSATPADVRDIVERRAKSDDASVDELVRWSRLRLLLRLDDRAYPETPSFSSRAVAKDKGSVRTLETHMRALRRHSDIAADKEDNARVAAIRGVLAVAPDHGGALSELGRTYAVELHHFDTARELFERALVKNPSAPEPLMRLARIREDARQPGLAEALLRKAAEAGGVEEKIELANFLVRRKEWQAARGVGEILAAQAPGSSSVARTLGMLADDASDLAAATAHARTLVRRNPTDHDPRLRLAAYLDAGGDAKAALAELETLLGFAPDLVEARRRAAMLADRLGQKAGALDHLAHALTIEPGNAKLRRIEGWLSGREKSFEDAFPTDVAATVAAAPDFRQNPDNQPYRYLLRRAIIRVNADGTSGVHWQFVAQVLNQKGVEDLDQVHAWFERGEQRARFKSARLFRGGAPPVEAERKNQTSADFPALAPGDVVEWSYRTDDLRQSFFGNYFGLKHRFQGGDLAAVDRSELILILPKARTFQFHVRNASLTPEVVAAPDFLPEHEGRRYVVDKIEFVPVEPAMPDQSEIVAEVGVSTYRNWDEFTGWWWNLIRQQYDLTDAMRAKVKELTATATSREEKIRAIYDFVVSDIRYVAWEFGVHGYKPYRSSAIFDRRFGDCKDKALVMNTMLKEVGIDGYPVLIRLEDPRSAEDQSLAMVEHFNHCIVAIPEPDGSLRFLDGTAEFHSVADLPNADRGAKVIVVRDGRAEAATIPVATPDQNFEREDLKVTLEGDGRASIVSAARMKGQFAVAMRGRFVNESDRKEELTEVVNRRFGQGTLKDIAFSKLGDLSAPVTIGYTFDVGDLLNRDGARARLRPLWSASDWTSIAVADTRRFDILLGAPNRSETTAEVALPRTWKVIAVPEDTIIEDTFARFELSRTVTGNTVRFERSLVVKVPRVAAADYPAFRRFVTKVAEADRETVTLEAVQ